MNNTRTDHFVCPQCGADRVPYDSGISEMLRKRDRDQTFDELAVLALKVINATGYGKIERLTIDDNSRHEVVAFAERMIAWLAWTSVGDDDMTSAAWREWYASDTTTLFHNWKAEQILAAARGERTLP